ncbi:MAG: TonB-dependent receptor plug domain-containing protein, partial [Bacteroidota bacterium]
HGSYIQGDSDAVNKNETEKDFAANSKFNSTSARAMIGWSNSRGVGKFTLARVQQQLGIIEKSDLSQYLEEGQFSREQREYAIGAPYVDAATNILAYQQTLLISRGSLQFNLSGQSSERKEWELDSLSLPFERVAMSMNTLTGDFRYVSDPSLKRGWTFGIQTMSQRNENSGSDTIVADARMTDIGLYALNRYSLSKVDLLFGARIDQRSVNFNEEKQFRSPSFSAGMVWKASTSFNVKMNTSTGFSAPNIYELTASGRKEGGFRYEEGNTGLRASRNLQADLGLEWEKPSIRFTANIYTNRVSDKTYLAANGSWYAPDSLPVYEFKQADATISGFESGLLIHPSEVPWVQLATSYGIVRGELSDGGENRYLPAQPADKLTASLTFSKEKMDDLYHPYLRFVASNFSARKNVAPFEPLTDGYTLLDVHVGGLIKTGQRYMEFSLSGMNLLNTSYYNHLSLIPRQFQVREMGRNICIRLAIPIGIVNPDKPVREEIKSDSGS